jgi:hypothetical protein
MTTVSRRTLLRSAALVMPASLLTGCAITSGNDVTTVTLNLATIDDYATAAENAATLLLGFAPITGALGTAGVAAATALIAAIKTGISALDSEYAGQATFSFSTASVPAALSALQADITSLFNGFETAITSLGGAVPAQITQYYNALQTIAALVEAIASLAVKATPLPMTKTQALAVLGVK